MTLGLIKCQREVVGKHLVVASPGSLHRDSVYAEELRRVSLAAVVFSDLRLEHAVDGPLELSQLTGKGWTTGDPQV